MDYKKAYSEALERANKFYEANTNEGYRQIFEEIFPELKESEDERIRKKILALVKKHAVNEERCQMEIYLEKQGSQNLANSAKTCKVEQNPAWSEEDERLFQIVIDILDRQNHLGNISHTDLIACIRKLKSLKSRVQPQPKQEWSKDDEERLNEVIETLNIVQANRRHTSRTHYSEDAIKKDLEWLKSRRIGAQPQWKPSDEQMEYLAKAITTLGNEGDNKTSAILCELRTDLKKLQG